MAKREGVTGEEAAQSRREILINSGGPEIGRLTITPKAGIPDDIKVQELLSAALTEEVVKQLRRAVVTIIISPENQQVETRSGTDLVDVAKEVIRKIFLDANGSVEISVRSHAKLSEVAA